MPQINNIPVTQSTEGKYCMDSKSKSGLEPLKHLESFIQLNLFIFRKIYCYIYTKITSPRTMDCTGQTCYNVLLIIQIIILNITYLHMVVY